MTQTAAKNTEGETIDPRKVEQVFRYIRCNVTRPKKSIYKELRKTFSAEEISQAMTHLTE